MHKTTTVRTFREASPAQHDQFLQHLSDTGFNYCEDGNFPAADADTQEHFDAFYSAALELLDRFYPERAITVSSRDPYYLTPAIKAELRRRNRLHRAGRVDEASALALRIGEDIANRNRSRLSRINPKTCARDLRKAVKPLTGRRENSETVDGITAESLNQHYAEISRDTSYQMPQHKLTAHHLDTQVITEWQLFQILDKLPSTATGMDNLPAWVLRIGAPVFRKPLASLFNMSGFIFTN